MFYLVHEWGIEEVDKICGPGLVFTDEKSAKDHFKLKLDEKIQAARMMIEKCEKILSEME